MSDPIRRRTYIVWRNPRDRCNNPNNKRYAIYGGRGIKVCERRATFVAFLSDMGAKPDGLSIDRIDNNGPYAPRNCRWATPKQQQRNSSNATLITHRGMTLCIAEWADVLNIPANRISVRLYQGWPVEKVLQP